MANRREFTIFKAGDLVKVQNPKEWTSSTGQNGLEYIVESVEDSYIKDHAYLPVVECKDEKCLHICCHPQSLFLTGLPGTTSGYWFDPLIEKEKQTLND